MDVPEDLEGEEPAAVSEIPGVDERATEELVAPDPKVAALEDEAACRAQLADAVAAGGENPVPCVTWGTTASAPELRAAVAAWPAPNWCDDHGANGKWYVNRFKACGIFPADLTVTNPRTGAVVGRMHYLTRAYAYSKRDIKTWAYQVELLEVSSSGAARGSSANGKGTCAGKCKVTESKFPSQPMSASKEPMGQFFLDTTIKTSPRARRGRARRRRYGGSPTPDGPVPATASPCRRLRCGATTPCRVRRRPAV